jgi:hypothetical protein
LCSYRASLRSTSESRRENRAGSNLQEERAMKTDTEKRNIVIGWDHARMRGLTQREYAAEIGIGERSLRSYIARFAPSAAPLDRVRKSSPIR